MCFEFRLSGQGIPDYGGVNGILVVMLNCDETFQQFLAFTLAENFKSSKYFAWAFLLYV